MYMYNYILGGGSLETKLYNIFFAFFLLRYNHINQLPFMLFKVFQYYFFFMVGIVISIDIQSIFPILIVFFSFQ